MKNIIITGCSRGIGYAAAQTFLRHGEYCVIGTSTTGVSPIEHQNFTCYPLSLDNEESIANFLSYLNKGNLSLYGLINNAGIFIDAWGEVNVDSETLRKTFEVNLFGTTNLTEKLLPRMEQGARIINISSNWGSFSAANFDAFHPHYKMSKAALNMYSKLLADRLKEKHMTVFSFDPGWVKTDMGGMEAPKEPLDVGKEIFDLFQNNISSGCFWKEGKVREW